MFRLGLLEHFWPNRGILLSPFFLLELFPDFDPSQRFFNLAADQGLVVVPIFEQNGRYHLGGHAVLRLLLQNVAYHRLALVLGGTVESVLRLPVEVGAVVEFQLVGESHLVFLVLALQLLYLLLQEGVVLPHPCLRGRRVQAVVLGCEKDTVLGVAHLGHAPVLEDPPENGLVGQQEDYH